MDVMPKISDPRLEQAFRYHSRAADLAALGDRQGATLMRCRAIIALGYAGDPVRASEPVADEAPDVDAYTAPTGWIDWRGIRQAVCMLAGAWVLIWAVWPR